MARRIQTAFKTPAPSASAPITNRESYPAWEHSVEEQLIQTLLTNTFGNVFYAKQKDLVEQTETVHLKAMAIDNVFYAKALVFAREKGYMKIQPIYGLSLLITANPKLAEQIFERIILTPNDLSDLMHLIKISRNGSQAGRAFKRMAGNWFARKISEYWIIKYGAEDRKEENYTLRDMLITLHPKGMDPVLATYIMGKDAPNGVHDYPAQLAAFERLKKATTTQERIDAINAGRLPMEVVSSFVGADPELWDAVVAQLPIKALVIFLETLNRHGVVDKHRQTIYNKLTSPEAIRKSKMFPYQFLRAFKKVQDAWLQDVLRDSIDLAFENVPPLVGKSGILLDTSGSMVQGDNIEFFETAKLYALALWKRASTTNDLREEALLYTFDVSVGQISPSRRDSLLTQADNIGAYRYAGQDREGSSSWREVRATERVGWGGTWTSGPLEHMIEKREKVDNLIVITDGQQNQGRAFADVLEEYRRKINQHVKVFVIDVSPYGEALMQTQDPNVYHIYGWSDQVLSYIAHVAAGTDTLTEIVKNMSLTDTVS